MNTQSLTIYGLSDNIAYCEAKGLSNCFKAYADYCSRESIMDGGIGFNSNSGYVYIGLENGIQICSMLGRDVEYLVTDFETGEENFFDTYEEAEKFTETI
jgi:hypothetical protein